MKVDAPLTTESQAQLRELVAEVAAAYFSNSHVSPADIPNVIEQIARSLTVVGEDKSVADEPQETPQATPSSPTKVTPAQIRKSITPEALISFEDNRPYKTLKRHLTTKGMTPAQYREKWGLPGDYPMVAASYSQSRSAFAKTIGLGQRGKSEAEAAPAAVARAPRKTPVKKAPAAKASKAAKA